MIPRLDLAVPLLFDMQASLAFYRAPPANSSYGLRQLSADNPDGYELCVTTPPTVR